MYYFVFAKGSEWELVRFGVKVGGTFYIGGMDGVGT